MLLLLLTTITTNTYAQVDADRQQTGKYDAKRSPLLSAGLSLVTLGFGGGQYYNKQYVKAGIMSAVSTGTMIWLLSLDDGLDDLGEAIIGAFVFLANWAYSVIDAPISSAVINKRYGLNNKITLSPAFERNVWDANKVNLGVKLTLRLD